MSQNLRVRFIVIALIVGFFVWKAIQGIGQGDLELGIDLKGGSEIVFEFDFEDETTERRELLQQAIGVIQDRLRLYALREEELVPVSDEGKLPQPFEILARSLPHQGPGRLPTGE